MRSSGSGFSSGTIDTAPITTRADSNDIERTDTHNTADDQPHDAFRYAQETITEVSGSEYFLQSGYDAGYDMSDTSSEDYLYHLSVITQEYAEQNKEYFVENFDKKTLKAIQLFGMAPYAMRQHSMLAAHKESLLLSRDAINHAKDTVVLFNHTMYDLIEEDPSVKLTSLASEISATTARYDAKEFGTAFDSATDIARGIRSEYAFKTIVEDSGLLNIRHATLEEDRKGVDFVIITPDEKELKIDVKSSHDAVQSKSDSVVSGNSPFVKTRSGNYIYYPLLGRNMFKDDTFELSEHGRQAYTMPILGNLQKMALQS